MAALPFLYVAMFCLSKHLLEWVWLYGICSNFMYAPIECVGKKLTVLELHLNIAVLLQCQLSSLESLLLQNGACTHWNRVVGEGSRECNVTSHCVTDTHLDRICEHIHSIRKCLNKNIAHHLLSTYISTCITTCGCGSPTLLLYYNQYMPGSRILLHTVLCTSRKHDKTCATIKLVKPTLDCKVLIRNIYMCNGVFTLQCRYSTWQVLHTHTMLE